MIRIAAITLAGVSAITIARFCPSKVTPQVSKLGVLREAKPGGFQTGGFPLFSGKVQIVSRTRSGLFLVGARPRKRKRTNRENPPDHPRANRESPGKSGKSKKDKKSRSGNPPRLKSPRLADLISGVIRADRSRHSRESGDSRESCESSDSGESASRATKIGGFNCESIRANRFARIALRIARATKILTANAPFPCFPHKYSKNNWNEAQPNILHWVPPSLKRCIPELTLTQGCLSASWWQTQEINKRTLKMVDSSFIILASIRNPEKGAFARGALRKFVANCAANLRKIAGISFRTSEEGCAKLSRICREFRTSWCKYPFSNAPLLEISDSPIFFVLVVNFVFILVPLHSRKLLSSEVGLLFFRGSPKGGFGRVRKIVANLKVNFGQFYANTL